MVLMYCLFLCRAQIDKKAQIRQLSHTYKINICYDLIIYSLKEVLLKGWIQIITHCYFNFSIEA